LLALVTFAVAAGFATFGLHPALVAKLPGAPAVYPVAFALAPLLHMGAAAAALAAVLAGHVRWRWLGALVVVYAASLGAELLGTTTGVPFGAYAYDRSLAPFWFGHVPVAIPLSWFTMALPAYALAARPGRGSVEVVVLGASLLTAWDLVLDPAMAGATTYWRWVDPGPYYGMPWVNLAGWMVTGAVIMASLELLGARRWTTRLPRAAMGWIYGLQFLLPALMAAAAAYWGAIAAAAAALAAILAAARHPLTAGFSRYESPGRGRAPGAGAAA
jgi:putative membrane protein